jgi:hypothetical protein
VTRTSATILAVAVLVGCQRSRPPEQTTTSVAEAVVTSSTWKELNLSGSLVYRGNCEPKGIAARFPLRVHGTSTSSPLEALRGMFADDPKMQLTQEPNGMIRMSESDVSRDVLNLKVQHIDFDMGDRLADGNILWSLYSSNRLLWPILEAPEVKTFMEMHHIHPLGWKPGTFFQVTGPGYSDVQHVSGRVENVTVSQALDRVVQSFPGLWVYRVCTVGPGSGQIASFDFLDNRMIGLFPK